MDIDAELLAELRLWIEQLGLSKYETFIIFLCFLVFLRLPTILRYFSEIRAIERDFQHKSRILESKIERERSRRSRKNGGKK